MQTLRAAALGAKHFGSSDVVTQGLKGRTVAEVVDGTACKERQGPLSASPRPDVFAASSSQEPKVAFPAVNTCTGARVSQETN